MQQQFQLRTRRRAAIALAALLFLMTGVNTISLAQNLGTAPQTNVAVQGQTGAQPEGAFLNITPPKGGGLDFD